MEMVPTAAVPEIDELFDDYDNEGSGNLSIVALKPQLKRYAPCLRTTRPPQT